jgi:hypothetical protein
LAKEFSKDPNAGGDSALNEMFQKLYADATEDQRRAMIKSYQESNGTSLSTNWEEVSKVRLDGKTFPATHTHLIHTRHRARSRLRLPNRWSPKSESLWSRAKILFLR